MRAPAAAVLFAALSAGTGAGAAADAPPAAIATVAATTGSGTVTLVGRAFALAGGRFEACMTIEKHGASGSTSTTQSGAVSLDAGASAVLATSSLSIAPGDRLVVDLVVTANGRTVASNRLLVGGAD